jgi:hypothetical protein
MKLTLLQLTQNILSALNSDEVNSIGDTAEAMQVATCIQTSYLNMQGRYDLPEHNQLMQLNPSDDPTQPVLMYRPDSVNRIEWIKYYNSQDPATNTVGTQFIHDLNVDVPGFPPNASPSPPGYSDIKLLDVKDFIDLVNSFNPNEDDVDTFSLTVNINSNNEPNTFNFLYKDSKIPQYCCIVQNYFVIFDSFDSAVDSTLQASKTLCLGWVIPKFVMQDNFIPNLDEAQVPMLLNEAKSLAFLELKNRPHQKAEQEVLRQLSSLSKFKALANRPSPFDQLANYGRR